MERQRQPLLICLGLALVTIALYWPVRSYPFIHFDDREYITENHAIEHGPTWECVRWAFTSFYASNWHPLTWLSHALDVRWFGLDAGAHHLVNLALHVAGALALFLALRRLTASVWRSAGVAALFALHPLQVESVAWASERKNTLSTVFWWLTIWAYAAYVARAGTRRPASRRLSGSGAPGWYALALALFALGLMAKQMLVTLPCVLLLLDYWPLGRWRVAPDEAATLGTPAQPGWRRWLMNGLPPWPVTRPLLLEKIPFFALTVAASAATFFAQKPQAVVPVEIIPVPLRLENAAVSYVKYLGKMLWPTDLAVFYPFPPAVPSWQEIAATLFLIGVTAVVVVLGRRRGYLLTGWLWYLGTLVPVIGLVQIGSQSMADRYAYVPISGLSIMLVWGAAEWASASRRRRLTAGLICGLALAVCFGRTRSQLACWESGSRLFTHTVQVTENNYNAHDNLATALALEGNYRQAMRHYVEALRLNPAHAPAHNDLGVALVRFGKTPEALRHYREALRLKPDYGMAHYNLAGALLAAGDLEQAVTHYRRAVQLMPQNADARYNLGTALEAQGKLPEAAACYAEVLRQSARYAPAHYRTGVVLAKQGRLAEAVTALEQALAIDPNLAGAHNDLGLVLAQQGRNPAAIAEYEAALRINPRLAQARWNLSRLLFQAGNLPAARSHLTEVLRQKPDLLAALRMLGEVLIAEGRWLEAVEPLSKAVAQDPTDAAGHFQLASVWLHQAQPGKAIAHFEQAARARPDWPAPAASLAWLLATTPETRLRDGPRAVQLAEKACELTRRQTAEALDALAAAYAESGRFADAVPTAQQALKIAEAAGRTSLAAAIQGRLKLYQAGEPYREQP